MYKPTQLKVLLYVQTSLFCADWCPNCMICNTSTKNFAAKMWQKKMIALLVFVAANQGNYKIFADFCRIFLSLQRIAGKFSLPAIGIFMCCHCQFFFMWLQYQAKLSHAASIESCARLSNNTPEVISEHEYTRTNKHENTRTTFFIHVRNSIDIDRYHETQDKTKERSNHMK